MLVLININLSKSILLVHLLVMYEVLLLGTYQVLLQVKIWKSKLMRSAHLKFVFGFFCQGTFGGETG